MGTIECRKVTGGTVSDVWGDGMGVYLIVIIMCMLLLFGTLTCAGCSVYFYYYYRKHNQEVNQEYHEQYWNHAGWQPMDGDGQVMENPSEEKKVEAEQQQQQQQEYPMGNDVEFVPPPYAIYNGSYSTEKAAQN